MYESVHILTYHALLSNTETADSTYVTMLDRFERHLKYLSKHNYQVISLTDFKNLLDAKRALPFKRVILTFDGPHRSWLSLALPLLKKYNYPATFFVVNDEVNQNNNLTWEDLKIIKNYKDQGGKALFAIESHSFSHSLLMQQTKETRAVYLARLESEIGQSKKQLDEKLMQVTRFLALPFGRADFTQVKPIAKSQGYAGLRACDFGWIRPNKLDSYNLQTSYLDATIYPFLLFKLALSNTLLLRIFAWGLLKLCNILGKLRILK